MKKRNPPEQLVLLQYLNKRMVLPNNKKQYLLSLQKGFDGELLFDQFAGKLSSACIVLEDLRLELNNSFYQIDTLILTNEQIYLYEIKNFSGKYYCEDNQWYKMPTTAVDNPLLQVEKAKAKLEILLRMWNFPIPITAKIVFVDPGFLLFQTPFSSHFLFHSEVEQHLREVEENATPLDLRLTSLADKLIAKDCQNRNSRPFRQSVPEYTLDSLNKGFRCAHCSELFRTKTKYKQSILCPHCAEKNRVPLLLTQAASELHTLFPDTLLSTALLEKWCGFALPRRRFQIFLAQNYKKEKKGKATIYTAKS
ncbi:nuclease-related domain-containing protein [Lacticigenium naphthae]|uniref:nuclease-related domain-containing protein n=1 Tax=Lacticigenium naphthae TaxID=515351 RepID=UPI00146F0C0C|nr:nuclease-related domain-containing protein [Lacticigenium naphthae]